MNRFLFEWILLEQWITVEENKMMTLEDQPFCCFHSGDKQRLRTNLNNNIQWEQCLLSTTSWCHITVVNKKRKWIHASKSRLTSSREEKCMCDESCLTSENGWVIESSCHMSTFVERIIETRKESNKFIPLTIWERFFFWKNFSSINHATSVWFDKQVYRFVHSFIDRC